MDWSVFLLVLVTVGLLALGQVLFKLAAGTVQVMEPRTLLSLPLLVALSIYGIATLLWLVVLARVALSVAFPFYGLTFLLVPLLAWLVLEEPIRPQVLVGGVIILIGIVVCSLDMGFE